MRSIFNAVAILLAVISLLACQSSKLAYHAQMINHVSISAVLKDRRKITIHVKKEKSNEWTVKVLYFVEIAAICRPMKNDAVKLIWVEPTRPEILSGW